VDFFETALRRGAEALNIEDVAVHRDSSIIGKSFDDLDIRQATGAIVLAVLRDGSPLVNPPGHFTLQPGDQLLALGTREQLAGLERLIAAGSPL
jgi:K+/H+ antiporter YhaU regulatory subunit KhtT